MNLDTTSDPINAAFSGAPARQRASVLQTSPGPLARIVEAVLAWNARSLQRLELAEMTDRELLDAGITRAQADAEAAKPFWRA